MHTRILQRDNGSWQLWYYDGEGKRKAVTLKIDGENPRNMREAEKAKDALLPKLTTIKPCMEWKKAWQDFEATHAGMSARRLYQVRMSYTRFHIWAEQNGRAAMDSVTAQDVVKWLDAEMERFSNRSWNEHLSNLKMILPVAKAVKPKPHDAVSRQPYTMDEIEGILDALDKPLTLPYRYKTHGKTVTVRRPYTLLYKEEVKIAIMLGAYCGMRLIDAVSLTAEQYDGEFISYTPSKTRNTSHRLVVVPVIHPKLKATLDGVSGTVTPNLRALHDKSDSMCARIFKHVFNACGFQTTIPCEGRCNASIGGFHALRHSYITWCAENGVPIEVVADCVGHTSIITTSIYNHISARRKALEMAKIMSTEHNF